MTPEERQMLGGLFQRVNAAAATQRDDEAEAFINDAVRAAPHAPYVLAQTVLVQQQALEAAASRLAQLEAAARQSAGQSEEHGSFLGNLGKTIFGGGAPSAPPRPYPDPQAYQRAPVPPPPPQGRAGPAAGLRSGPASGLSSAATSLSAPAWPLGPAPGPARRRLFAERSLDRGGRRGRRRARQSPWRVVRRPGGGGLFGGSGLGGAGFGGSGLTGNTPELTEINNYYDDRSDGGSDANFQQFDPGAPGVQDANFDNLDDSTFDGSDGSSSDDGGGYDDV